MGKNKRLTVLLVLMILMTAIIATGNFKEVQAATAPEKNTILIRDYKFLPAEITIQKGETITWINQDAVGHTATAGTFDSGLLNQGQSFKQTFNETGIFDYYCAPHPFMKGKVTVQ